MARGKDEELEVTSEELLEQTEGSEDPNLNFEDDAEEDPFEIVSEDEVDETEEESEQQKAYDQKIASLEQQFQQMQQQSQQQETSQRQDQKMDQIAEILKEMKKSSSDRDQENSKGQTIDWKKKRSEWQENFWEKPLDIMDDYTQNTVGPVVNQLQGEISRLKKQVARQNATTNSKYKSIIEKYPDEVDEYVKNFDGDEKAYEKAASFVAMNHFEDLVAEKAKEMQEQQSEPEGKKNQQYTGVTEQPKAQRSKRKNRIVLPQHQKREFERQFAVSVFDNKQDFYNRVWLPRQRKQG